MNHNIHNLVSIISGRAPHITLNRLVNALSRRIRERDFSKNGLLEITTTIGCPVQCSYCPQGLLLKSYMHNSHTKETILEFENFRNFLKTVPRELPISFAGMSEPWAHPDCTRMVCDAAEKGHPIMIFTTLQGMNLQDYIKIQGIPFKTFTVHLPNDTGQTGIQVDDTYLELLKLIIRSKPNNLNFTCHVSRPERRIRQFVDWYGPPLHNRAGNTQFPGAQRKVSSSCIYCELCGRMQNRNVLLPDGTVLLCSMDFGMKHVLGNLGEVAYPDLFTGDNFQKLQKAFDDPSLDLLCRGCVHAISD